MLVSYDDELNVALRSLSLDFDEVIWLQDHIRISHEERDLFLNNEIENPQFVYTPQDPSSVLYEEHIKKFKETLAKSTAPAVVIDLYERKIEKQILRNGLISSSLAQDDEAFYKFSKALYGKPRRLYFAYVAKRVLELASKHKTRFPAEARRLRSVLGKVTFETNDIDPGILPPPLLAGKPIETIVQVVEIFQEVLDRCAITDWKIEVGAKNGRNYFSVNRIKQIIFIPNEEQLLSRKKVITDVHVKALAEHEVGVHVRRAFEAKKTSLRLLEIGLDGYLSGEEGLATYVQQQIEGASEFYGLDRYLASGLAVGMDGVPRDFRSVFGLMVDYYTLEMAERGEGNTVPYRTAWDVCVRTFRGTTGQSAGCIFTKDIVYLEGNIGIWSLLVEKPHIFQDLFIGKFNPLIKRHVNTLQTLEILSEW
jgi:hypothetical protein